MVVTYISVSYTSSIKMSEKVESSQTIVNLKDNRDAKGHFFIGTGYVGTETYYYYYYQTKSGSFKADKIRTDKCEVFYTKDTPHIDTIIQIPDEEQTKNWLTLSWLLSLQKINKSICNINYTDTNARIEKYVNKPDKSQFIPIFYISLNNECTFGDEYYYKIYIPNNAKANDVEE